MPIGAVVGVEAEQVHLLDRPEDRPDQVVLGHPVAQRRRHQKRLLTITFDEVGRHAGIVLATPDATPFPDSHHGKQECPLGYRRSSQSRG
jgi:hypothetical protein